MLGITSAEEIASYEPTNQIISVFVVSGYDRKLVNWLDDTWEEIHGDTGVHWKLLVPVKDPRRLTLPSQIDLALSGEIREMYDIPKKKTPCLVFDNFLEEEHQKILSLQGDDDLLKSMMLKMTSLIEAEVRQLGDSPPTERWRREVTRKLFDAGQWTRAETKLFGAAQKAFSLLPSAVKIFLGHPA
ncbi:hypothetical protein [Bradyrhizobium sp. Ec3.3]|uniref:hypothetical protein n=1 Tax=Bradyrhizobium sp. Ec3.3 TaxID=189753 RepID=UPI000481FF7A|nr:hypothetical protein [Bradyrhizobium sp. Ec3.3]